MVESFTTHTIPVGNGIEITAVAGRPRGLPDRRAAHAQRFAVPRFSPVATRLKNERRTLPA
jgi:hypothetical protein